MRLLLVTNHFYPEVFRCNDLAFNLARRGYEVSVLTAIPDYPLGEFHKGFGIFRKRVEWVNGVKVYRSFTIPRGKGGVFRLLMNYGSSFVSQCWNAFWLGLFGHYDYVLVHETSPVMVGVPGIIVSRMKKIPMYFWVLDLWPESLQDAGGVDNPVILGFFSKLTTWIYRHSRRIMISSRGFRDSICEKGDFGEKLVYFPNWADAALSVHLSDDYTSFLPKGFCVLFAGNIGEAQDMDSLMETALLLKEETDVHFCIVGDGRKRPWVERFVHDNSLERTVHLLGRHPIETMPAFFAISDVLLVTLKDSRIFNRTVPAKIQAYMNAGKPIAAMMNGEGALIIKEAGCGTCVGAGDSRALAASLKYLRSLSPEERNNMGEKGKRYCDENFSFKKTLEIVESLLHT